MGDIRCASYSVYLVDEFGRRRPDCDFTDSDLTGRWRRQKNGSSFADLELNELTVDGCCPCQPDIPNDRLVIERVGDEPGSVPKRVWSGRVSSWNRNRLGFSLEAVDDSVLWWGRQRRLKRPFTGSGDQSSVWLKLAEQAGLVSQPTSAATGVQASLDLPVGQFYRTGFEALDLVCWTVVGDRLYGPAPSGLGLPALSLDADQDFANPGEAALIGSDLDAYYDHVCVWWDADRFVTVPESGGLWPLNIDLFDTTEAVASVTARRLWDRVQTSDNLFVVTGDATLDTRAGLSIDDLVPCRLFTVNTDQGCGGRRAVMELCQVVVGFESAVVGGRRVLRESRVAVDLAPPGFDLTRVDLISI